MGRPQRGWWCRIWLVLRGVPRGVPRVSPPPLVPCHWPAFLYSGAGGVSRGASDHSRPRSHAGEASSLHDSTGQPSCGLEQACVRTRAPFRLELNPRHMLRQPAAHMCALGQLLRPADPWSPSPLSHFPSPLSSSSSSTTTPRLSGCGCDEGRAPLPSSHGALALPSLRSAHSPPHPPRDLTGSSCVYLRLAGRRRRLSAEHLGYSEGKGTLPKGDSEGNSPSLGLRYRVFPKESTRAGWLAGCALLLGAALSRELGGPGVAL